jgi:hypothetical protein
MEASPNQVLIEAFFKAFKDKIERLRKLKESYPDEAFTLCLIYIDRLASGHFGGRDSQNRKNFWQAPTHLSGNPLFGMLHPGKLHELAQKHCPTAAAFIASLIGRQPNALLDENQVAEEIRKSTLLDGEKRKLIENLWRSSIANITYDSIRTAEVHGPGSGGLSFDKTLYNGRTGVELTFDTFYEALQRIQQKVSEASLTTGHWFGNPNYMRER